MRTEGDYIKINEWLKPLSWLYGLGVTIRNKMFDIGILNQKAYDVPVISVGNITVGGSGKTVNIGHSLSGAAADQRCAVGRDAGNTGAEHCFRNRKDGYRLLPDGSVPDDPENKRHGCRLGTG